MRPLPPSHPPPAPPSLQRLQTLTVSNVSDEFPAPPTHEAPPTHGTPPTHRTPLNDARPLRKTVSNAPSEFQRQLAKLSHHYSPDTSRRPSLPPLPYRPPEPFALPPPPNFIPSPPPPEHLPPAPSYTSSSPDHPPPPPMDDLYPQTSPLSSKQQPWFSNPTPLSPLSSVSATSGNTEDGAGFSASCLAQATRDLLEVGVAAAHNSIPVANDVDALPGLERPYANYKEVKLQQMNSSRDLEDIGEPTGELEAQEMGFAVRNSGELLKSSGYVQGSCEFEVSESSYMQGTSDGESEEVDFLQELISSAVDPYNHMLCRQKQPANLALPEEYLEYTSKEEGVAPQQATPPANEDPPWYKQRDSFMLQGLGKGVEPNPHGNQNGHTTSHDSLLPLPYETAPNQRSSTNKALSRSQMASRPLPPSPVETCPHPVMPHLPTSPDTAPPPPLDPMANRPLPLSPDEGNEWWVSSSSTDLQKNGRGATLPSLGLHPRLGRSMSGGSSHNPLYRKASGDSTLGRGQNSSNGSFATSTLPSSARRGRMRSGDWQDSAMERRWQSARKLRQYSSESDQVLR